MVTFEQRLKEINASGTEGKTFAEFMSHLDGQLKEWVINDLAELTKTSKWQVAYGWQINRPIGIKRDIISQYLNKPESELFPAK